MHQPKTWTQDSVGARAAGWRWFGPLRSPAVGRLETSACRCTVSVPPTPGRP